MADQLEKEEYPSLSIGIVHDQELVFAKAYGVADRKSGRQATLDSLYPIGSVTKVFTTTLMCILRDQGKLRLDDPVSQYLPDSVKLPTDPNDLFDSIGNLFRIESSYYFFDSLFDCRQIDSSQYAGVQFLDHAGGTQIQCFGHCNSPVFHH